MLARNAIFSLEREFGNNSNNLNKFLCFTRYVLGVHRSCFYTLWKVSTISHQLSRKFTEFLHQRSRHVDKDKPDQSSGSDSIRVSPAHRR